MNTNPTTHPAQAREMARELREKWAALEADAFRDRGDAAYNFDSYNRNNAASIATTLDALADECERLRSVIVHTNDLGNYWHRAYERANADYKLLIDKYHQERGRNLTSAAPAQPQHHADFRHAAITDYLNGTISAGKLCELLGIERAVGVELVNALMNAREDKLQTDS